MLQIHYRKFVPYPRPVVLSQYYDYEHIEHVHPETLGSYLLLEQEDDRLVYEHLWPESTLGPWPWARQPRSVVEHRLLAPWTMRFTFLEGRHGGHVVDTKLEEAEQDGEVGTVVEETYRLPGLPNWSWLGKLIFPAVRRSVDRVWDEDLEVEVCIGGWPGLPAAHADLEPELRRLAAGAAGGGGWLDVAALDSLRRAGSLRVEVGDREIALFHDGDANVHAVDHRCPHTGGPLAIGSCDGVSVTCPWHGARFELATGRCVEGPGGDGVQVHSARTRAGRVEVRWNSLGQERARRTVCDSSS